MHLSITTIRLIFINKFYSWICEQMSQKTLVYKNMELFYKRCPIHVHIATIKVYTSFNLNDPSFAKLRAYTLLQPLLARYRFAVCYDHKSAPASADRTEDKCHKERRKERRK